MIRLNDLAATPELLVALDVDGTLAPLHDQPMQVRMAPEARAAVHRLAGLPATSVALVSGRTLHDVRIITEHDDSPLLLAGSHGAEFWLPGRGEVARTDDPSDLALRDVLRDRAEALVTDLDGAWIEPKTFGFAVHTRLASEADGATADRLIDDLTKGAAPTGGAALVTTSSSTRFAPRAKTRRCRSCASIRARPRCSSRATTSPTKTPWAVWTGQISTCWSATGRPMPTCGSTTSPRWRACSTG
jgi:hypothetical protein